MDRSVRHFSLHRLEGTELRVVSLRREAQVPEMIAYVSGNGFSPGWSRSEGVAEVLAGALQTKGLTLQYKVTVAH
jgi:hypothetical protein